MDNFRRTPTVRTEAKVISRTTAFWPPSLQIKRKNVQVSFLFGSREYRSIGRLRIRFRRNLNYRNPTFYEVHSFLVSEVPFGVLAVSVQLSLPCPYPPSQLERKMWRIYQFLEDLPICFISFQYSLSKCPIPGCNFGMSRITSKVPFSLGFLFSCWDIWMENCLNFKLSVKFWWL